MGQKYTVSILKKGLLLISQKSWVLQFQQILRKQQLCICWGLFSAMTSYVFSRQCLEQQRSVSGIRLRSASAPMLLVVREHIIQCNAVTHLYVFTILALGKEGREMLHYVRLWLHRQYLLI